MYDELLQVDVINLKQESPAVTVFHGRDMETYLKWVVCFRNLPCVYFQESMTIVVQFPSQEMRQRVLDIMHEASPVAAV